MSGASSRAADGGRKSSGVGAKAWRLTLMVAIAAGLGGCAVGPTAGPGPVIDTRYSAVSQGPRVDLLVIHYTALDFQASLRMLTQDRVSSHYLVDVEPPTIYRLVEEGRSAHHAGVSAWQRRQLLNTSSIGIEIVNRGWVETPQGRQWAPYPPRQIDAVVALVKDIVRRHGIAPDRIVGHSDIAPGRKQDPGPLFPWKRLADEGLIHWPDADRVAALRPVFEATLPEPDWFRQRLARLGYLLPFAGDVDRGLREVLQSFQMRYRPERHDGLPDAETAALLVALLEAQPSK